MPLSPEAALTFGGLRGALPARAGPQRVHQGPRNRAPTEPGAFH